LNVQEYGSKWGFEFYQARKEKLWKN
jgi:hypothetical protein